MGIYLQPMRRGAKSNPTQKDQGMKRTLISYVVIATILCLGNASAATRYVDLNSPNSTPPYTSWAMAATNIQDAIDAAENGDLVLVTNGIYATGGRVVFGAITNRVAITKPLIVQSVNGPAETHIVGNSPAGPNAVRCAYLTNQAQLIGFTLTNGATLASGDLDKEASGGGVWCEPLASPFSLVPILSNCVITANVAIQYGGGTYNGRYINCVVKDNVAFFGGGARGGYFQNCLVLNNTGTSWTGGLDAPASAINCTIVSNTSLGSAAAGGVSILGGTLRNCIIYYNTNANPAGSSRNVSGAASSLRNCNTINTPALFGGIIITNASEFLNAASGDFRLPADSLCINAGDNANVTDPSDLSGATRIVGGTVDIGAYEFQTPSSVLSFAWAKQFNLPTDGSADFVDLDSDGANNYAEWRADTNPTNALSVFKIVGITNTASGIQVTWNCVSSRIYYMERGTNDFANVVSFQVINNFLPASGFNTRSYTDTTATNVGPYFYRVGVR